MVFDNRQGASAKSSEKPHNINNTQASHHQRTLGDLLVAAASSSEASESSSRTIQGQDLREEEESVEREQLHHLSYTVAQQSTSSVSSLQQLLNQSSLGEADEVNSIMSSGERDVSLSSMTTAASSAQKHASHASVASASRSVQIKSKIICTIGKLTNADLIDFLLC